MSSPAIGHVPVPPPALIDRIGRAADFPRNVLEANPWLQDPVETYQRLGVAIRDQILAALPAGWSLEGKRVLDFGCGSGRVLRRFVELSETVELWGCDIDRASVEWLQANLSPPLRVLSNGTRPPLELLSEQFDLIYAVSVFTHLTEEWSSWLLELRRLLKPDGLLVATFHGPGVAHALDRVPWHEPWDEERIGMHILGLGTPWDEGGPSVLHGRWWLEAHWGRAFDVLSLSPGSDGGHGMFVGRKTTEREPSREELERLEPGEPREVDALAWSLRQARSEITTLRANDETQRAEFERTRRELKRSLHEVEAMRDSRSWRLTRPFRTLRELKRTALTAARVKPRGAFLARRLPCVNRNRKVRQDQEAKSAPAELGVAVQAEGRRPGA